MKKNNIKTYYTVDTSHVALFCRALLLTVICVGLYFALGYAEKKLKRDDLKVNNSEEIELVIFGTDTVVVINGVVDTVLKGGN